MQWMEREQSFFLFRTLTNVHFQKVHLPSAQNASVFEVTFLEQLHSITDDKTALIVLYGASERSMDASTAADKLQAEGFQ
jgi:hypothetical protein